jgi:type VI secretion system protein ImpK
MTQADTSESRQIAGPLALLYQEVLTAVVRLRANSQYVTDVARFREQIKAALKDAERDAVQRGYLTEDVKLASFVVVAFLDESILNSQSPAFAAWTRQPLQEELYGVHIAGEIVFRNLERIMQRPSSNDLSDVLEVHQLCLLLGFRGRFSLVGHGELRSFRESIGDRIRQIRGVPVELAPHWKPLSEAPRRTSDPWVRRLLLAAATCFVVGLVLWITYLLVLRFGVRDLQAIAEQIKI